jgi:hypothetical protein
MHKNSILVDRTDPDIIDKLKARVEEEMNLREDIVDELKLERMQTLIWQKKVLHQKEQLRSQHRSIERKNATIKRLRRRLAESPQTGYIESTDAIPGPPPPAKPGDLGWNPDWPDPEVGNPLEDDPRRRALDALEKGQYRKAANTLYESLYGYILPDDQPWPAENGKPPLSELGQAAFDTLAALNAVQAEEARLMQTGGTQ